MATKKKWEKLLLAGWPELHSETLARDLVEGDPGYELRFNLFFEADDNDLDFVEAAHRMLKLALGVRRFTSARRALFEGKEWESRTHFMCRQMALAVCREFGGPDARSPLKLVDGMMRGLLVTESELEEWKRGKIVMERRNLTHKS